MDKRPKLIMEENRSEGQVLGTLARAAWAVTRNFSEGRECGGSHQGLSLRTELVGVSLVSDPPNMYLNVTKHGRFCKQNNQLPTKSHNDVKDNSNNTKYAQLLCCALRAN